jgi:ABC-type transport system involved in cytochrome c biogenesis, permease component
MHEIVRILIKDVQLEWRQKYSIYGLLLYVVSAVLVIYFLLPDPEPEVWNVMYWLILLFSCVNAVAKSFLQESKQRNLYYYQIHSPVHVIAAKMIYNLILMVVISLVVLLVAFLLLGIPKVNLTRFIIMVLSGSISLSLLFSMLAAIAGRADGNSSLIAILGFPLVFPQLILISDLVRPCFEQVYVTGWGSYFAILWLLNGLIVLLALILFPYLWKE